MRRMGKPSNPLKTSDKRITPGFAAQAGKGRPKGVVNKVSKEVKEMVAEALDKAGGVDYLVEQAEKNPKAFMSLVGRIVPLQVNAAHSGSIAVDRVAAKAEVEEIFGPPRLVVSNG